MEANNLTPFILEAANYLPPPERFGRRAYLVALNLTRLRPGHTAKSTSALYGTSHVLEALAAQAGASPGGGQYGCHIGLEYRVAPAGWYLARIHWEEIGPQVHRLKCSPEFFQEVWNGTKAFEVRFNDRGYSEGDMLELVNTADGKELRARVTYLLQNYIGLSEGWVCMSLELQ